MKRALKIVLFSVAAILLFALPPLIYEFLSYYHALQDEVVTRFSGKRWNIPSRIYSDSCFVYPGQSLDDLGFFQRLARLNYHRVAPGQIASRGEYSLDEKKHRLTVFLHSFAYPYSDFAGEAVEMTLGPRDTVLAMRDPLGGKPLFSVELEPELISGIFQGNWQQRRLVPLAQIPPAFIDAILAAEDHRFYEHHGIDLVRIVKAAWVDFSAHRVRQGGSTLTQQLMKNFFLTSQRDWRRKVKESADGVHRRAPVFQGRDSGELHQRHLPRAARPGGNLRRVGGVRVLLLQGAARSDDRRDGDDRRDDKLAQPPQPDASSANSPSSGAMKCCA